MSSHGGFREGAGRPSGSTNKSLEQTSASQSLPKHTEEALQTLVDVARNGRTDAARIQPLILLNELYGKPAFKEKRDCRLTCGHSTFVIKRLAQGCLSTTSLLLPNVA